MLAEYRGSLRWYYGLLLRTNRAPEENSIELFLGLADLFVA